MAVADQTHTQNVIQPLLSFHLPRHRISLQIGKPSTNRITFAIGIAIGIEQIFYSKREHVHKVLPVSRSSAAHYPEIQIEKLENIANSRKSRNRKFEKFKKLRKIKNSRNSGNWINPKKLQLEIGIWNERNVVMNPERLCIRTAILSVQ